MPTNPALSYQLYSSRNFPDLARQARMVAEIGFRNVEPYDALLAQPEVLRDALDQHGLKAPTAHIGLAALRADFGDARRRLRDIGVQVAVVPFIPEDQRPRDATAWRRLGEELQGYAQRVTDDGLRLAWHNHDFEFVRLDDGSTPLDCLLGDDPLLGWQADIAWLVRAQQDPAAWISRYAERIVGLHVKDLAPPGENKDEDGWADVGHGRLDWASLLPVMRATSARIWTVEHDNPSDDRRFARRSFAAVSGW